MREKLDKKTLFQIAIALIFILTIFSCGFKIGIIVLALSFLVYTFITKKYMFTVFKAVKAYKIEEYQTSLNLFREASASPYCNAGIIGQYLICELKYGKASIAYEYISEVLKNRKFKGPDLLKLKITYSTVLWKNNYKQESINLLKDLLKNNKSTYLYEALTSLLICSGNISEANTIINEALEYDENSTILKSNYGEINYKLGNYQIAEKTFNEVLESEVKFVEPYFYLSLIESQNKNFERAKELLETAQGLNESIITSVKPEDINNVYSSVVFKSLNI